MQDMLSIETPDTGHNPPSESVKITQRERAWFIGRMKKGEKERFTEVVTVTPGIAALMLRHNEGNRPLRRSRVEKHIDRLQRGDFILHHQGIALSKCGVLNDGQSRLTAIMETGIPGEIQVTFGADRKEFTVIDQAETRSASDTLAIHDMTYSALRASVAGRLFRLKNKRTVQADPQLVARYAIDLQSKLMDEALAMGVALKGIVRPTPGALAYYVISDSTKYPDKVKSFFWGLKTGENVSGALLLIRNRLIKRDFDIIDTSVRAVLTAHNIILAWNSHVQGKRTFQMVTRGGYRLPEVM